MLRKATKDFLLSIAAMGVLAGTPAASGQGLGAAGVLVPDVECLALNIYHEARGEPVAGKVAVGHVVLNRVQDKRFPNQACAVVRQGGEKRLNHCQFSWWCDGRSDQPRDAEAWAQALDIAKQVYDGKTVDPTGGALWYHADYVSPSWGKTLPRGPKIGRHIFYGGDGSTAENLEPATGTKMASLANGRIVEARGEHGDVAVTTAEFGGHLVTIFRFQAIGEQVSALISRLRVL